MSWLDRLAYIHAGDAWLALHDAIVEERAFTWLAAEDTP